MGKRCWVGLAATDRQLQQARLRSWAQPNKLVFWGASLQAEREESVQLLAAAFANQPQGAFWKAAETRARSHAEAWPALHEQGYCFNE
eukprot:8630176-Alexandrium_andersonii.AAC.1